MLPEGDQTPAVQSDLGHETPGNFQVNSVGQAYQHSGAARSPPQLVAGQDLLHAVVSEPVAVGLMGPQAGNTPTSGGSPAVAERASTVRMCSPGAAGLGGAPLDAPAYCSDHFRMTCYKVLACSRRTPHDWKTCPFVHPGEHGRRRPLSVVRYEAVMCPFVRHGEPCPSGDSCTKAHNIFEMWLHPDRYRTQICIQGTACTRKVCFFAHTPEELRRPRPPLNANAQQPDAAPSGNSSGIHPLSSTLQSSNEQLSSNGRLMVGEDSAPGSWPPLLPSSLFHPHAGGGDSGVAVAQGPTMTHAAAMGPSAGPLMFVPVAPAPTAPALNAEPGYRATVFTPSPAAADMLLMPPVNPAGAFFSADCSYGTACYAPPLLGSFDPLGNPNGNGGAAALPASALAGRMGDALWVTQPAAPGYTLPPGAGGSNAGFMVPSPHLTAPISVMGSAAQAAPGAVATPMSAPQLGQQGTRPVGRRG